MFVWFLFGFMCAVVILIAAAYFKFASLKKAVLRSKLRLDIQCKKRRNLIPTLSLSAAAVPELGRAFAYNLNKLKDTSTNTDTLAKYIAYEAELSNTFHQLFVQTAKHEELDTDKHFQHLRHSIMDIEGKIQASKKRYNSAVRDFNTLTALFPLNLIARLLEFESFEYFDFTKSI